MGLTSIFEWNNNLSAIFDPAKNVAIKDFTHKVAIEVNEKGSRASAVTGILLKFLRLLVNSIIICFYKYI